MTLRIRYIDHKFKENHRISLNDYTSESTGAKYRVILNLEDMEFYIRNERTKEYVFKSTVKYTNINVLKRNARGKLEKYGVKLSRESRNRCFGICNEGYSMNEYMKELEQED